MIVLLLLLFLEVKNGWRIGAVSLQRVLHSSKSTINRGHTFSKQVCLVISLLCHWACEKALLLGVIASWHTRPARERRHSLARALARRNEELFRRLCASKIFDQQQLHFAYICFLFALLTTREHKRLLNVRSWRFFVFRKVRDTAARELNRSRNKTVGERAGEKAKISCLLPSPLPPSFPVSTSVQLSCGSISYFTKHNSRSTPKNRQLRGLTNTLYTS